MELKTKIATIRNEKVHNLTHYFVLPLQLVGCWDWYPNPPDMHKIIVNYVYLFFVLFVLSNATVMVVVSLYTEYTDIMSSLKTFADTLPYLTSVCIIGYFAVYRTELYELIDYMNREFKFHSARGLTNMTMLKSYKMAKNFANLYTTCALGSSIMYAVTPLVMYWWLQTSQHGWYFMDVNSSPYIELAFLRLLLAQTFMGITLGQLGVFFASNSILLCGQLDLICCSIRNVRFTALLKNGAQHGGLASSHADILDDERHNYLYNDADLVDSVYHYDEKLPCRFSRIHWDIYSQEFDESTEKALVECARMCQIVSRYKQLFEKFASPLLVLRVVQVTLYLCTLLYAASQKFDMVTVEYMIAVSFDIFIYCYYGNQIIVQADRVSVAAYQSLWPTMGVRPRRLLVNILLANKRQMIVKAGRFLPMDLKTYVTIIKTSFSYYTLLVNVNEHK